MDNGFYLLSLSVSGVKSIKKEIRFDFYKKTIDKSFDPNKYRIKAIYGENGSGKSAIITAVNIFKEIITNDNYLSESKNQSFLNEILNKQTNAFEFKCEFFVNLGESATVYNYTIRLEKGYSGSFEIRYEKLMKKNGNYANGSYKVIFESVNGELSVVNTSDIHKKYIINKSMNLLSLHSLVYVYILNISKDLIDKKVTIDDKEFTVDMMIYLSFVLRIKIYLDEQDQHELYFLRKKLSDNGFDRQVLGDNLIDNIDDVWHSFSINEKIIDKNSFEKYENKVKQLSQFIKVFKPELISIDIEKKEDGDNYICDLNLNYGEYVINKEFESTGIKKLIRLFDCFLAASNSGIVFIDEMDSNLNDIYLCKLIEYFMYYGKGQLCFTTHNLDPMIVLKENKNSIDFLSTDNNLVHWISRGNSSPDNFYRNGMIEDCPFNIDSSDFIGIFGE